MLEQIEFNEIPSPGISALNEPHLACVLLLDTSGSMMGSSITNLNNAINNFKDKTLMDEFAKKRVDIAIIEFNSGARIIHEFSPISHLKPVTLEASGLTDMGEGILLAIETVKKRNEFYSAVGTPCYKPWIFMITDGEPTDDITLAKQRIFEEENKGSHGKLKFWAIGVPGFNENILKSLTKRSIALNEAKFENIFNWLSESMVTISVSNVDENPQLSKLPIDAQIIPDDW